MSINSHLKNQQSLERCKLTVKLLEWLKLQWLAAVSIPLVVLWSIGPLNAQTVGSPAAQPEAKLWESSDARDIELSSTSADTIQSGTRVMWNDRPLAMNWTQWQINGEQKIRFTGIADVDLMEQMGVELLNTDSPSIQPVRWFSDPKLDPIVLPAHRRGPLRYLDITPLADIHGWQITVEGETLNIVSPPARVQSIRHQPEAGSKVVIELDRPTAFGVSATRIDTSSQEDPNPDGVVGETPEPTQPMQQLTIRLDAIASEQLCTLFGAKRDSRNPSKDLNCTDGQCGGRFTVENCQSATTEGNPGEGTTVRFEIPLSWRPRLWTHEDRYALTIDLQSNQIPERDIAWAPGVRWRQQGIEVGSDRFSVVWLEVNPTQQGISLRPISVSSPNDGIAPLSEIATTSGAAVAINGGFFNRNNQLPLGAIRRDGWWFSSPILDRGAIAWNDVGSFAIARLSLVETVITHTGERLPVQFLNSGYVKAGISRYTPDWGSSYTPLIDNEIVVVVERGQVTEHLSGGMAGENSFEIPESGYLLTLRAFQSAASKLEVGSSLRVEWATDPRYLSVYPHILGAGPVLLRHGLMVLDATGEQFNENFSRGKASRSAIGKTERGTLVIATVHNRIDGPGPTLTEMASIMEQLGAIDALNLDGGGSTTLYLGGQLLEHPPRIVPRVHNGLGIFIEDPAADAGKL
ncbi:phosphodiester glycosidase family protein [Phormidium sp. CCY1219]|uniref:phosphodiester glycosidase family protein n=1 Tax=Phormidium sp. CCY1219 TaxID=2886104 RepID=UPI002D1F980B|nr:phosphodiester glycosidase family protein [Phormidium sp. CCY1219]MEB3829435.1 phosphodiester glycosidase family protein [Phormidium sp. CCY1219]